ncbi:response regulator [bacterium SCSIO 12741]|nr:response regulator [bacterium SCSIO 12741]
MTTKKVRVLVVEDEPAMAMLLERLLEQLGFEVIQIVRSGEESIEVANQEIPDIILMDIYLEGEMNGIQAAEQILSRHNIPVIYSTSDADEETLQNAKSTYPLGYILKPYSRNVLKSTIEVALSIKEVETRKNEELKQAYHTITQQTQEILDSFKSAQKIQQAILPGEPEFREHFPESFILNLPKESLGGDFFWYKYLDTDELLFAVVDCTGHGVPGALMSILVNYQLTKGLSDAKKGDGLGQIFQFVDKVLSDTYEGEHLGKAEEKEIKNLNAGFDSAMCLYNEKKRTLRFCGAKRPLYLVRDGEVHTYSGNRASVGLFDVPGKSFQEITIPIQPGDRIYLASDGYQDQMGGKLGKRLKSAPFRQILLEMSQYPITEGSERLMRQFNSWRGIHEQIDDVLILGMEF